MKRKTRDKLKIGLISLAIIIGIFLIILAIFFIIKLNKKPEVSYKDILVGKNYFSEIKIDLNKKEVTRDGEETSLKNEFDISTDHEEILLNSEEELKNFLNESSFDISVDKQIFTIKNPFQTKTIIIQAENIEDKVEGEDLFQLTDELYIAKFYSEKLTKAMYNYYKEQTYIKKIYTDEIYIIDKLNDISQTMYGETPVDLNGHHVLGTTLLGLNNYVNIVNENGNPSEIVISTIGYGVDIHNDFVNSRISEKLYNFILNNTEVQETIPQGSRIAEVIVDSTPYNVKLMPLVIVTEDGYTSLSSILNAIDYGIKNSDVICYELINKKHETIDLLLEKSFKENVPFCSVTAQKETVQNTEQDKNNQINNSEIYPANHGMTISVSSIDRESKIADYSGKGPYIDFALPSTDIEEIFNPNSTVSRWSGPQYSNAEIVSIIALIKTYNKDATIKDIYNFIRDYCIDLGENGHDDLYGYGLPNFSNIKISDIDKEKPKISNVIFENETWEVIKQVKIVASDNIRIKGWTIKKGEEQPKDEEWNNLDSITATIEITSEITENGKYGIWVQDTAGNKEVQMIQVDKVDNTPPKIAYSLNTDKLNQGYVTINVTAEDLESGLYDSPFSWDQRTWSQENSQRTVSANGRYIIYAEDNLGNVGQLEILVDCFPQAGKAEIGQGNIISSIFVSSEWNGDINNKVQIKLNKEIDIIGWQISQSVYVPSNFIEVNNNSNMNNTSTNNSNNINLPNNVVWNASNVLSSSNTDGTVNMLNNNNTSNLTNTTNEMQQSQINRNSDQVNITTSLNINTDYYLWIKDRQGNTSYQTFKIMKVEI